jgi:hypothetical protein
MKFVGLRGFFHKKMASKESQRYDHLPLLSSLPGGVRQEQIVPACRCNIIISLFINQT